MKISKFDFLNINLDYLKKIIRNIPEEYYIVEIDEDLVDRVQEDLENDYLFKHFPSAGDFLLRGMGFCAICDGKVVSAATLMLKSNEAIEIETHTVHRRKGLAAAVGASLLVSSINRGIKPMWIANSIEAERLAIKLGYTKVAE